MIVPQRVESLPKEDREAGEYERLLLTLEEGEPAARVETARLLCQWGPPAVGPLCDALRDKDPEVRIASATSLGEIGDPAAVPPLTEALRACFVRRSARWQMVLGLLAIPGAILLFLVCVALAVVCRCGAGVFHSFRIFGALFNHYRERRAQSRICGAVTHALARIAERSPTPELRTLLPEMHAVAADMLQQEESTRTVTRDAARRIEDLTENLASLPLPTAAPGASGARLPRPAEAPAPDAGALPRASSSTS